MLPGWNAVKDSAEVNGVPTAIPQDVKIDIEVLSNVAINHTNDNLQDPKCPIWIRQVLLVLLTAGATGYQYYLCYLALISFANDFSREHYSEMSIPTWLQSIIIGEVALSGLASFCRRVINVAFESET